MLGEIYQHTPAVLTLHGRDLPISPTKGMKEGCPLSPTLFLLYYDILLRETKERCPEAQLYVFVDDIAVRAPTKETLLHTLDTLDDVAYTMGLRYTAVNNKGEMREIAIVFRGVRVFRDTFFPWGGGGCLKATNSGGRDGWVTGGGSPSRGAGFFQ